MHYEDIIKRVMNCDLRIISKSIPKQLLYIVKLQQCEKPFRFVNDENTTMHVNVDCDCADARAKSHLYHFNVLECVTELLPL